MKRFWIRAICFLAAALLALQLLPWPETARGFLGLSPVLGWLGALAARVATPWLLLAVPVLAIATFRSRWFCRYLCPTGFAAEFAGRLNPRARGRFARWPNVGRVLLAILAGAAACGVPLFIWLDPLALFNGFVAAWRVPVAWSSFALAAGFPLILLLSAFAPNAWCQKVCPLGAAQDLMARLRRTAARRKKAAPEKSFGLDLSRREFLGAAAGGAAALALRRTAAGKHPPIRPPGARPEDQFAGLCARCGACLRVCPYGILKPDLGAGGVAGLLAPAIDYSKAHCFEYCNECTKVCPTGAIERLALEAKRNRAIGLAEIDRNKCIAWHDRQYCMVCHEFCPYLAIDSVAQDGVECPTVKPDMCRGCGACQVNCPALPDKAIVVKSIPQRPARPLEG